MLMHPSLFLFYLSLVLSIFLIISANSWFIIWVGLEMNLIFFIPLMLSKTNKYSSEASIKYFLVQAFTSVLIISSSLILSESYLMVEYVLLSAIFLKTGSAPFHQWLPSLVEGLSWGCLMILFILQKVSPLLLVSFLLKETLSYSLVYTVIVACAVIGSVGGLMSVSLRKIMAYSSISHMSWVLSSMLLSNFGWVSYYVMYSLVLICTLSVFNSMKMYTINQLTLSSVKSRLVSGISLLSLGGLPPFTGFVPKFMVSVSLLQTNTYFIFLVLLMGTFLSLFFYLRLVLVSVVLSSSNMVFKSNFELKKSKMVFNVMGSVVPSLAFLVW
uniref:NADH-ubiquinone oxidoreductase chain 2 n=1 Tax=Hyalella sp. 1356B TaxID=2759787 RepID=A0A7T8ZST9_9CRUS|nr:NADH dehydrogenase subunit 2 [Hyalella sp. 1356B]